MRYNKTRLIARRNKILPIKFIPPDMTWEMYRRKLKMLNRNRLIVFVGAYFGIFLSHEVIMLVDVPVHKTAQELGVTRTSIYTKYTGLSPP